LRFRDCPVSLCSSFLGSATSSNNLIVLSPSTGITHGDYLHWCLNILVNDVDLFLSMALRRRSGWPVCQGTTATGASISPKTMIPLLPAAKTRRNVSARNGGCEDGDRYRGLSSPSFSSPRLRQIRLPPVSFSCSVFLGFQYGRPFSWGSAQLRGRLWSLSEMFSSLLVSAT